MLHQAKRSAAAESGDIIASQVNNANNIASDLVGHDLDSIEHHVKARLHWVASSYDVNFMRALRLRLRNRLAASQQRRSKTITLELSAAAAKGRAKAAAAAAAKA